MERGNPWLASETDWSVGSWRRGLARGRRPDDGTYELNFIYEWLKLRGHKAAHVHTRCASLSSVAPDRRSGCATRRGGTDVPAARVRHVHGRGPHPASHPRTGCQSARRRAADRDTRPVSRRAIMGRECGHAGAGRLGALARRSSRKGSASRAWSSTRVASRRVGANTETTCLWI